MEILSAQAVCRPRTDYMIGLLRKRRNAKQHTATYGTLSYVRTNRRILRANSISLIQLFNNCLTTEGGWWWRQ
jgi:hypothetical protein